MSLNSGHFFRKYFAFFSVVALVVSSVLGAGCFSPDAPPSAAIDSRPYVVSSDSRQNSIAQAFHNQTSNVLVESSGFVVKILPDDRSGSRHQRFIVRLSDGLTILISHNIDLAPRVDDLKIGNVVRFCGEYEWNVKGGVVHWTHHDPHGHHQNGWLEYEGKRYE